jgi:hypothetical protein
MKIFKISSITTIVIGCIHTFATPLVASMFKNLDKMQWLTFIYMFVMTGFAMIFAGWIQFYSVKNQVDNLAFRKILKVSTIFILISVAGGVATMWDNPFAYFVLIVALYQIIAVNKLEKIKA